MTVSKWFNYGKIKINIYWFEARSVGVFRTICTEKNLNNNS